MTAVLVRARTSRDFAQVQVLPAIAESDGWTGRFEMSKYAIIFEKSSTGFGAYALDLPGCIATGKTLEETRERMHQAIAIHIKSLREDGDSIPDPTHFADMMQVA